jgi:non-heme chloroperoxidase
MMVLRSLVTALMLASAVPALAEPTVRMIAVEPGVELRATDAGPTNGNTPVLLIPGWGTSADIWAEQAGRLARNRRVVSIDPRSQGGSTMVAHGITPEQRARDLAAVLDAAKLQKVVLVGWSQGVQDIAAYVQAFGTAKIVGVVLVDSTISSGAAGLVKNPQQAAQQLRLLSIFNAAPKDYAEGFVDAITHRPLDASTTEKLVGDVLKIPNAVASAALVADLFGADRTPAIAKLDRPTLVIASAASPELPAMQEMTRQLPDARIEAVADAAHAVFIDQPERFAELLDQFLTRIDAPESTSKN